MHEVVCENRSIGDSPPPAPTRAAPSGRDTPARTARRRRRRTPRSPPPARPCSACFYSSQPTQHDAVKRVGEGVLRGAVHAEEEGE